MNSMLLGYDTGTYTVEKYKDAAGNVYEGSFLNGLKHFKGDLHDTSGDRYQGFFEKGLKHGQGTIKYKTGEMYKGNFEKGFKAGQGMLYVRRRLHDETRENIYDWESLEHSGIGGV